MREGLLAFWPKISVKRYRELKAAFGTIEAALAASEKLLANLRWKPEMVADFCAWRKTAEQTAEHFLKQFDRESISVLTYDTPSYPVILENTDEPPYRLFVRGNLALEKHALAVVGSRQSSPYGEEAVKTLIPPLAEAGISIISGLATGIDSLAHQAALSANGHTVAVLGFGIGKNDLSHSKTKQYLAESILTAGGAIVSEYLPGTPGSDFTFPTRNRIIAGLSKGTMLVEAKAKSGALITVSCARDAHREIMVVPHHIFSNTGEGVHAVLKEGAHPITCPNDVFFLYGQKSRPQNKINLQNFSPSEQKIINTLRGFPTDRDTLARTLKIPIFTLANELTSLELQGVIEVRQNQYRLA